MKNLNKTSISALLGIVLFLFVSCPNDTNDLITENTSSALDDTSLKEVSPLELKDKVLKFDEIKLISKKISNYQKEIITKKIISKTAENEMERILQPLVNNGKEIHSEMINYLKNTGEFNKLTIKEQSELLNLDEKQLVELSFFMSSAYELKNNTVNNTQMKIHPRVRACLSAAIGIGAISDLISNTGALGTVETTLGAIRLIGRRYLGWIGVGLMVMDFADCYYGAGY